MSSATCVNLDQSKILSSGNGIVYRILPWTLYDTMMSLDTPEENAFEEKALLEKEKIMVMSIVSFSSWTYLER